MNKIYVFRCVQILIVTFLSSCTSFNMEKIEGIGSVTGGQIFSLPKSDLEIQITLVKSTYKAGSHEWFAKKEKIPTAKDQYFGDRELCKDEGGAYLHDVESISAYRIVSPDTSNIYQYSSFNSGANPVRLGLEKTQGFLISQIGKGIKEDNNYKNANSKEVLISSVRDLNQEVLSIIRTKYSVGDNDDMSSLRRSLERLRYIDNTKFKLFDVESEDKRDSDNLLRSLKVLETGEQKIIDSIIGDITTEKISFKVFCRNYRSEFSCKFVCF